MTEPGASKPTIVAIDDDQLLLDLIKETLDAAGYDTQCTAQGQQGLPLIRERKPALVLLDITLPDADGMEILRQIRLEPGFGNMPVVMLTARRTEQDVIGARRLGANDYLIKPFKPEDLVARMARLLQGNT